MAAEVAPHAAPGQGGRRIPAAGQCSQVPGAPSFGLSAVTATLGQLTFGLQDGEVRAGSGGKRRTNWRALHEHCQTCSSAAAALLRECFAQFCSAAFCLMTSLTVPALSHLPQQEPAAPMVAAATPAAAAAVPAAAPAVTSVLSAAQEGSLSPSRPHGLLHRTAPPPAAPSWEAERLQGAGGPSAPSAFVAGRSSSGWRRRWRQEEAGMEAGMEEPALGSTKRARTAPSAPGSRRSERSASRSRSMAPVCGLHGALGFCLGVPGLFLCSYFEPRQTCVLKHLTNESCRAHPGAVLHRLPFCLPRFLQPTADEQMEHLCLTRGVSCDGVLWAKEAGGYQEVRRPAFV